MAPTVLVVGNGLALDLCSHAAPLLDDWHPSRPLSWTMGAVGVDLPALLDCFPRFSALVERDDSPGVSDFDIFARCLAALPAATSSFEACVTVAEARHFLALAYSYFQVQVDAAATLSSWRWARFLDAHRHDLAMAISFNYELVLESVLAHLALKGSVFKPHGSIDFAPHPNAIVMPTGYPLQNCVDLNDMPPVLLARDHLLQPRLEADIVLPTEYSPYSRFQWVRPGYEFLRTHGKGYERCLMIGISYWDCDRDEIDVVLDCLPRGCELVIANPQPSAELLAKGADKGLKVTVWDDGPP